MGLQHDLERFRSIGEEQRQDLTEFIQHGDLGGSDQETVSIPIKIIDLPEFVYDDQDQGGVGQASGQPDVGDPVDVDDSSDGDDGDGNGDGDGDGAGSGGGEHGYYEMDPEEFAKELDEELGLDLDPKGKEVIEEVEGDFTDITRTGPNTMLDFDELFKRGLKRKLAVEFDEDYIREALKVEDVGPRDVFEWARSENIPVGFDWLSAEYEAIPADERITYPDWQTFEATVERTPVGQRIRENGIDQVPFRRDDERYRHPEIVTKEQKNVVVINIRDVSGSMDKTKRELVERVFTPMDWYLQGKYDNAEFHYIAHDHDAWEVDREDFFGIQSGGGTKISSAYVLAEELLEAYPWNEWNRYVFAAGDGENSEDDTRNEVLPRMQDIDANKHAYLEVGESGHSRHTTSHGDVIKAEFRDDDGTTVEFVSEPGDVLDAISNILEQPDMEDDE